MQHPPRTVAGRRSLLLALDGFQEPAAGMARGAADAAVRILELALAVFHSVELFQYRVGYNEIHRRRAMHGRCKEHVKEMLHISQETQQNVAT